MRKGVSLVVFAVALVVTWLGYSKYTQARRESFYRSTAPRLSLINAI
jgi:uncharacterized membrane protein YkgB